MNRRRHALVAAALALATVAAGCSDGSSGRQPTPVASSPARAPSARAVANPAQSLPLGTLSIDRAGRTERTLSVQIAATDQSRDTGLMGITSLPENLGMAFVFDGPTKVSFWMQDTLIPLDIAFWDATGRVITLYTMVPCTTSSCPLYSPTGAYVGAVEMGAGLLKQSGITLGDHVTLKR